MGPDHQALAAGVRQQANARCCADFHRLAWAAEMKGRRQFDWHQPVFARHSSLSHERL